jgi:hypothetical protein
MENLIGQPQAVQQHISRILTDQAIEDPRPSIHLHKTPSIFVLSYKMPLL